MKFTKEKMREKVSVKPTSAQLECMCAILAMIYEKLNAVKDGSEVDQVSITISASYKFGFDLAKVKFSTESDLNWTDATDKMGEYTITISWAREI